MALHNYFPIIIFFVYPIIFHANQRTAQRAYVYIQYLSTMMALSIPVAVRPEGDRLPRYFK
jgi:hypothetical protein